MVIDKWFFRVLIAAGNVPFKHPTDKTAGKLVIAKGKIPEPTDRYRKIINHWKSHHDHKREDTR